MLNYEDEVTRKFGEEIRARVLYFSSKRKLEPGVYLSDNVVYYNDGTENVSICNVLECNLLGLHNYENIMAAVACAVSFEMCIRDRYKGGQGKNYRCQWHRTCHKPDGVYHIRYPQPDQGTGGYHLQTFGNPGNG